MNSDNGDTWTLVIVNDPYTSILAIVINQISGHIFVGTFFGGGVYRSSNNGDSWMKLNLGSGDFAISSLAINSQGHVFGGESRGCVYRSTNNGDSWTQLCIGRIATVKALVINKSGRIFAGTVDGMYRSTNNGDSWTRINDGLTSLDINSLVINAQGEIFAGASAGVFRSGPTTAVHEIVHEVPSSFMLEQNYPNPFNPETEIRFSIPKASHVVMKIFNTIGEEIHTLADAPFATG
jgi:ligand-binding sensor domain-containing protein